MDPIYKCQVALDLDIGAIISGRLVAGAKDLNVRNTVIIGAGIIGLAIAHHLQKDGVNVTVVDRDPEGDKASFGNAGGFAVTDVVPASVPGLMWRVPRWLIDPLGPLSIRPLHAPRLIPWLLRFSRSGSLAESSRIAKALSALNSRTYDDLLPMLADAGLSAELQRRGALTLYETAAGFRRDAREWNVKRFHGIDAQDISGHDARSMEPALGPLVYCAVFTPQWSHINDPKRMVDAMRNLVRQRGAQIVTGEVRHVVANSSRSVSVELADGRKIMGENAVVAAGAWSGQMTRQLGDHVLLESERGYNATITDPGICLSRELIFAERKFVATPLTCGLRIGGAAEFGGLNAKPNFQRSRSLTKLASMYLPNLKTDNPRNWAGHRPATPDSLPVIDRSTRHPNIFYAFGHGHYGLTQAATTGRLAADLVLRKPPSIEMEPYSVRRFAWRWHQASMVRSAL